MLVVTGQDDDRVPLDYVEGNVERMTRAGGRIRLEALAGADHFMVFSRRDDVCALLDAWYSVPVLKPRSDH